MISVQKKLQERVPGFHFNLGFSGGYFLHGSDEEDEGDWELLKNADKFWWFSHMWLHKKSAYKGQFGRASRRSQIKFSVCKGEGKSTNMTVYKTIIWGVF